MFKINTKKIAVIAIFMALGVVLKFFSIGSGEFRISVWEIPMFLIGILVGPFYGGVCALGADLIYGLAFSPYPFSIIMMFTTVVWGHEVTIRNAHFSIPLHRAHQHARR